MKNIPDKCLKCGAPIKWDKFSNYIDCEYCGYSNLINLGSFSNLINSLKIPKKSSINLFHKGKRFSKSLFLKAKNSSSKFQGSNQFRKNKKLIFIIPITLLSVVIVGRLVNREHTNIANHYEIITAQTPCKIKKIKKDFIYINRRKLDSSFIGCWKKKNLASTYNYKFYFISVKANRLNIIDRWETTDQKNQYTDVSDISFKVNSISANYNAKVNNYQTKRTLIIKNKNTLNVQWNHLNSSNSGNYDLIRHY